MSQPTRLLWWSASILIVGAIGCSSSTVAAIPCLVTLDDKPLPFAAVTFVPEQADQMPVLVTCDAEGACNLGSLMQQKGLRTRTYKVLLAVPGTGKVPAPPAGSVGQPPPAQKIPAIYSDLNRTPLQVEVPPSSSPVVIALRSNAQ